MESHHEGPSRQALIRALQVLQEATECEARGSSDISGEIARTGETQMPLPHSDEQGSRTPDEEPITEPGQIWVTVPDPLPEHYFNSVRVHVGVHDAVIDILADGPTPGQGAPEHSLVARLRTPVSALWATAQVLLRVSELHVQRNGMFGLPDDYLEQTGLSEAYRRLRAFSEEEEHGD